MAMIKCPECGNPVSSRATACVKCGLSMSDIFVCPECGEVNLREGTACKSCGCPFDIVNSGVVSNNIGSGEQEQKEVSDKNLEEEYTRIAEKIISEVLARHSLTGSGFCSDSGLPLNDKRKVDASRVAFRIPKDENIFFIASGNIMGGINESSKGFAITSFGIYFRDDNKKTGMFYLDKLADLKISTFMSFLKIGSFEFNIGTVGKLKNMMLDLQDEVINHM